MSFTNDQLGLNARSVEDILLYDRALASPAVRPVTCSGTF